MHTLDNERLNRIKDEVSKENNFQSWKDVESKYLTVLIHPLWEIVCGRYAEEETKEISDQAEHWQNAYHNSTERERCLEKHIFDLEKQIAELKEINYKLSKGHNDLFNENLELKTSNREKIIESCRASLENVFVSVVHDQEKWSGDVEKLHNIFKNESNIVIIE